MAFQLGFEFYKGGNVYASFYKVIMCHHEVKTYCSINGFFFWLNITRWLTDFKSCTLDVYLKLNYKL